MIGSSSHPRATSSGIEETLENSDDAGEPGPGVVLGRYRVERVLARSPTGMLVLAHDPELDRHVALELVSGQTAGERSEAQLRARREAESLVGLAHPNLVRIYDVGVWQGWVFVVMQQVERGTLRDWIGAREPDWRALVSVFGQAAAGLSAAHERGLIHGNFTPEHVLVGDQGDRVQVAFEVGAGAASAYMSPEQVRGEHIDARSDQFSFCVALWEALHGERPFVGISVSERSRRVCAGQISEPAQPERVPERVRVILRRGLAVDPQRRWPDMHALAQALDAAAHEPEPVESPPGGPRWLIPALVGVAALIAALVSIWAVTHPERPAEPDPSAPSLDVDRSE